MLLKTIARKTLELKNHKIDKIKETPVGKIEIYISHKKRRLLPCKKQKGKYKVVDQLPERSWKHVSLWGREVEIIYSPCRVMCHGKHIVEDIPWSMGKIRITTPLIARTYWYSCRTSAMETGSRIIFCSLEYRKECCKTDS